MLNKLLRAILMSTILAGLSGCMFFAEPPGQGAKATAIFKTISAIVNESYKFRIEHGAFPKRLADLKFDMSDFTFESENKIVLTGKSIGIEYIQDGEFPTLVGTYAGPGMNGMSFSYENSRWSIGGHY